MFVLPRKKRVKRTVPRAIRREESSLGDFAHPSIREKALVMESGSAQDPPAPRGGENYLRALIDYVSDGLSVVDLATGRYLDVNRHKCESLGYTREEMLGIRVGRHRSRLGAV